MENAYKIDEQSNSQITNLCRCFSYCTELPIRLYSNDKLILSLPERIDTINQLLSHQPSIPLNIKNSDLTNVYRNEYKETFIVNNIIEDDVIVVVGPLLTEEIESGEITNMIRTNLIPFHQRSLIQSYYQNLIVISEVKLYYLSKLIENMFQRKNKELLFEKTTIHNFTLEDNSLSNKKNEYRKQAFIHSPYANEQEVSNRISNGDIEGTKALLKEINIQPHAKLASTTIRSYKNSIICSCAFMTRAAIAGGLNADYAFTLSDTYINQIENFSNIKDLESFELIMAESFAREVSKIKNQKYSPAVLKTINYIDSHLCEDLKINTLAKEVFLNPSYLSNLFHIETGKTITDWILNKKIHEAALFIRNGNESIAEIAFFFHFTSQSYFVQCFKKVMGMTPGEYRKKY